MVWGMLEIKTQTRIHFQLQCAICHRVPDILSGECPIIFFQRSVRHFCIHFMSGYRNGFTGAVLDYVMKQYEGNCRIPQVLEREILMNVDEMQEILAV